MSSGVLSAAKVSKKVRAPNCASASASATVARRIFTAATLTNYMAFIVPRLRDACGLGQQYLAGAGARVAARQRGAHAALAAFDVHELAAQLHHAARAQAAEHAAHRRSFPGSRASWPSASRCRRASIGQFSVRQ